MTFEYYCKRISLALSHKEIGMIISKIQQLRIKSSDWITVNQLSDSRRYQIDNKKHWNQPNLYEKNITLDGNKIKFHEQYTVIMCPNCGDNLWIMQRVFDETEEHEGVKGKKMYAFCESGCSTSQMSNHITHLQPKNTTYQKMAYEYSRFDHINQ